MKGDKAAYLTSGGNRNPLFKWEDYNNWCFKIENLLLLGLPRSHVECIETILTQSSMDTHEWQKYIAEQKEELDLSGIIVSFVSQYSARHWRSHCHYRFLVNSPISS